MNYTIENKEEAVSPVIGTILMVALTVIMIAIITAVVMPMAGGNLNAGVVGITVNYEDFAGVSAGHVSVVFTGGDYDKITNLKAYAVLNDGTVLSSDADDDEHIIGFGVVGENAGPYTPGDPIILGKSYILAGPKMEDMMDLTIIATINGNDQIIYKGSSKIVNQNTEPEP